VGGFPSASCARVGACRGALGLGIPVTLVLIAVATHYLVGLDWPTSLLVGAILAPTDPLFASAIVSRREVPLRLRKLLSVESGVNDGLALPFVLVSVVAALVLLVVRPAAMLVSLWGAAVPRRELYAAAWFGPKGFASVVFVLLVVQTGIPPAQTVFELVALTIALSMVVHSMSDVPVARAFQVEEIAGVPTESKAAR
jgi:NhaP-type Na+/H+ or K+/H+ antiporter